MKNACAKAFNDAKQRLMYSHVLVHFDPSTLAGDASGYGVGVMLETS